MGLPLPDIEADGRRSHLRRGWYWGRQAVAERVLALGQSAVRRQKGRAFRSTGARRSSEEAQAAQWLKQGLAAAELSTTELAQLKGSDPRKVALARHLWERTVVSQDWLAKQLQMGSAANVSQQIRRAKSVT